MRALDLAIMTGKYDDQLFEVIGRLKHYCFSEGEKRTLETAWERLDRLTDPDREPPCAIENVVGVMYATLDQKEAP